MRPRPIALILAALLTMATCASASAPRALDAWSGGDFVQLVWDAPNALDAPVTGYYVYRAIETGDWRRVTAEPLPRIGFVDMPEILRGAERVSYRVTGVSPDGSETPPSNVVTVGVTAPAARPSGATYNKNDIISNRQLVARSTMDLAAVQDFLVTHKSYLATYRVDDRTAAQHISDACETFGVNPRVVLTTLQKEQGLITDTDPTQTRLNRAMGWNEAVDSTLNFADQVLYGTRQWRLYYDRLTSGSTRYVDQNGLVWTVGATRTVFDGTVTPANEATAGLYIYTPYIGGPTGIGGNYLFWRLWTETFEFGHDDPPQPLALLGPGSPTPPGTAVATTTPTLTWQLMSSAAFYELTVDTIDGSATAFTAPFVTGATELYTIPTGKLFDGGTYRWRLKAFDAMATLLGTSDWFYFTVDLTTDIAGATPMRHRLHPAAPNPFNATTRIRFSLPREEHVSLSILDATGRGVAALAGRRYGPGTHAVEWHAEQYGSGVYIVRLRAGAFDATQRVVLVR